MADDSELDYLRTLLLEIMPGFTVKHYSEIKNISMINDTKRALLYPGEILTMNDVYYTTRYKVKISAPNEANLTTVIKKIIDGSKKYNRRHAGHGEITLVTCLALADCVESSSLHFTVPGTTYYIWLNKGLGADPVHAGETAIECDISGDTTATTVAETIDGLIDAKAGTGCDNNASEILTITNTTVGNATDCVDEDTGFEIDITTQGGFTTCASLTYIGVGSSTKAYEVGITKRWNIDLNIDIVWSVT